MNDHLDTRFWTGVDDPAHPLSRHAHDSVTHGRYIYVMNGFTATDSGACMYERAGLTRYDPLTGSTCFLPVHWDYASAQRRGFSLPLLNTSGMAMAVQPESKLEPAYIYTFAGFSLWERFHTNALIRYRLPRSNQNILSTTQSDPHAMCCHAEVVGGHGLLSFLLSLPPRTLITEAFCLTALRAVQRRWNRVLMWRANHANAQLHCEPSPRDKLCMEYWRGRLFAFGGYGPRFSPHAHWPSRWIRWPFLYDPTSTREWFPCELDRGWNSQLLVFDVHQRSWSVISRSEMRGAHAPNARAAHQSALDEPRGWMLIFGGRGPPVQSGSNDPNRAEFRRSELYESGRLNDLYCLNLALLEWTRILTPLDKPQLNLEPTGPFLWPSGRSWMGFDLASLEKDYSSFPQRCLMKPSTLTTDSCQPLCNLCVVGGFSNANQALSDAWLIRVSRCPAHGLEAQPVASSRAEPSAEEQPIPVYAAHRPRVTLVNGFRCVAPDIHAKLDSLLTVHRNGSHYSISESSHHPLLPSDPFVEEDLTYHMQIYAKATFDPKQGVRHSTNQVKPNKPFYQIAKLHTDFILFLITQLMLYQPCIPTDGGKLTKADYARLAAELTGDCTSLLLTLRPSIQIVSLLLCILAKFMLPWESLCMLLRETDAWLPRSAQTKLLDQLSSFHAGQSATTFHLILSNQEILDKFAFLLPLEKVRIPAPYRANSLNSNDQLSYHIRHTIPSTFLWYSASPLKRTVDDPFPSIPIPETEVFEPLAPVARFWHSVTHHRLDGMFYVIGGATTEAMQRPVEFYDLLEPRSLFDLCLKRAATLVLQACHTRSPDLMGTVSVPHVCLCPQEPMCSLCGYLEAHLTGPVQRRLIEWLM